MSVSNVVPRAEKLTRYPVRYSSNSQDVYNSFEFNHPNVLAPRDAKFNAQNNQYEFYMPPHYGFGLNQFTYEQLLMLLEDVWCGIKALHSTGVAHMNISPETIIVYADQKGFLRASLVDFSNVASLTSHGPYKVNPLYLVRNRLNRVADYVAFLVLALNTLAQKPSLKSLLDTIDDMTAKGQPLDLLVVELLNLLVQAPDIGADELRNRIDQLISMRADDLCAIETKNSGRLKVALNDLKIPEYRVLNLREFVNSPQLERFYEDYCGVNAYDLTCVFSAFRDLSDDKNINAKLDEFVPKDEAQRQALLWAQLYVNGPKPTRLDLDPRAFRALVSFLQDDKGRPRTDRNRAAERRADANTMARR